MARNIDRKLVSWKRESSPGQTILPSMALEIQKPAFKNRIALRSALDHKSARVSQGLFRRRQWHRSLPHRVEVNAGWSDTKIIMGLPNAAVRESRARVSTAITNSGYKFPMGRTNINLEPADVKKEGPSVDLPMPTAMLTPKPRRSLSPDLSCLPYALVRQCNKAQRGCE